MSTLIEALEGFRSVVQRVINYNLVDNDGDRVDHKRYLFEEISQVGVYSVGVCRWSALGNHDPVASVVYLAQKEKITTLGGTFISPLVLKELWSVAATENELWYKKEVRTPLPKKRWWHWQRYDVSHINEITICV